MIRKLPVLIAVTVASQWAPLTAIMAEDDTPSVSMDGISVQLMQDDTTDLMTKYMNAEKMYLTTDTDLLVSPSVPAASSGSLAKREEVFLLDTQDDYSEISDGNGNIGWIASEKLSDSLADIFDETQQTMYVLADSTPVYAQPDVSSEVLLTVNEDDAVTLTGISTENLHRVEVNGHTGYIDSAALTDHLRTFSEKLAEIQAQPVSYTWTGAVLNRSAGSVTGPSGKETYYNLDMSGVISAMRAMGFNETDYPYWVRSDGAKMLGPYIMVAADLSAHPRGSIISISLGEAIVADTGGFVSNGSGTKVDVAVNW